MRCGVTPQDTCGHPATRQRKRRRRGFHALRGGPQSDPALLDSLSQNLRRCWTMSGRRGRLAGHAQPVAGDHRRTGQRNLPLPARVELDEIRAFLQWTTDGNFTFLGYRDYDLLDQDGELILRAVAGSGLGILRDESRRSSLRSFACCPASKRQLVYAPTLLILTKASARSTVHRPPTWITSVSSASTRPARYWANSVPGAVHLARLQHAAPGNSAAAPQSRTGAERASLSPVSHSARCCGMCWIPFPRRSVQIGEAELYDIAIGILHLQERQRLRLFVREDIFGRFVFCIVYVPLDRYTPPSGAVAGHSAAGVQRPERGFSTQFSEAVLTRYCSPSAPRQDRFLRIR